MTSSSLEPAQNWRGAGGAVKSVKAFRGATSLSRAPCGFHIKLCAFQECRGTTQQRLEPVPPGDGCTRRLAWADCALGHTHVKLVALPKKNES